MTRRARRAALLLSGAVLMGGMALALRAPRITLLNTAWRIDHPWMAGAGAVAAALGCALWAAVSAPRMVRIVLGLAAGASAAFGVGLLTYRLDVDDQALAGGGWLGRTVIPWAEVSRVESGPRRVVVWGVGDEQIRIDTAGFAPAHRAALDRSIARHVHQAAGATAGGAAAASRP